MHKKKKLLLSVVLVTLLCSGVAYAVLTYTLNSSYKVKAYIVPATKHIDLGDLYTDADGESGSVTSQTWGTYKTWQANTTFNVDLANTATLSTDFSVFNVTIYFGSSNATVDLTTPSSNVTIASAGTGNVTFDIIWTTKADSVHETTRTNLAIVDITK